MVRELWEECGKEFERENGVSGNSGNRAADSRRASRRESAVPSRVPIPYRELNPGTSALAGAR